MAADLALVQVAQLVAGEIDRRDPGPSRVHGLLGEVLLGLDAQRRGLHAHGEVLRDDRDVLAVLREVHRDGEDATVVVGETHPRGQDRRVGVVELDAQRAVRADRDGEVQASVFDTEFIEVTESLTCEVPDLGVVPLTLELGDDDDGNHDVVFGESEVRPWIRQQHGRIEHVGA